MVKKRLTLSLIACSLMAYGAPADSNSTTNQNSSSSSEPQASLTSDSSSVDLGDVEVNEDRIEKKKPRVKKRRVAKAPTPTPKVKKKHRKVKSYSPVENIKRETRQVAQAPSSPAPATAPEDNFNPAPVAQNDSTDKESIKLENISKVEIKNADVAEAIAKNTPSVSLVRRSGVANDLIVRGLKKDNISISIDGSKVYGACPNRMDPPLSHVLANNIDYIEVKEGNDVTEQGAMGASIKVHTLEPTKEFSGDMNFGLGRWNYRKLSTYLSGGVGDIRFAVGLSTESSGQYEDGAGKNFAEQLDDYISTHPTAVGMAFKPNLRDMDAYTKSTMMGKIFWDITENQTLKFSYTANRSKNILYPNSKMDADYDNSDLYNVEYEARNLGAFSDKLNIQYYHTEVDHPMSTQNRLSSIKMGVIKHQLSTEVEGGKVSNKFTYCNHKMEMGVDYSKRNWDGLYYKNGNLFPEAVRHSIWDVDTTDIGGYIKDTYTMGDFIWDIGLRYDKFEIDTPRVGDKDRDFDAVTGNLMLTYLLNQSTNLFIGAGSGYRVPDGKELYYRNKKGMAIGNDDLEGVRTYELDAGFKYNCGGLALKLKGFYNYLKDDILFNASAQGGMGQYQNVDAYIYGLEFSGGYTFSDSLSSDFSLSWLRGKKDEPLEGQSDLDLPEIPPLRVTFGVDYMPTDTLTLRTEFQGSTKWSRIDSDNGEQELAGWGVVNFKLKKSFGDHFEIIAGVDNILDQKYTTSNTYKDLTLITGGNPSDEVMTLHEPGRYTYVNFRYKF